MRPGGSLPPSKPPPGPAPPRRSVCAPAWCAVFVSQTAHERKNPMQIRNPFGITGTLDIHAFYKIGGSSQKFGLDSSGNATSTASVKWDSFNALEMFFVVEYMLFKPSGADLGGSKGKFGFSARWLASFT